MVPGKFNDYTFRGDKPMNDILIVIDEQQTGLIGCFFYINLTNFLFKVWSSARQSFISHSLVLGSSPGVHKPWDVHGGTAGGLPIIV